MLSAINTVKGAVAKKDLVPILTHLHFYNGRVQGSNGKIVIDAPCPEAHFDFTVPLEPFIKAVEACGSEPVIHQLEGKIRVSAGRFRADISVEDSTLYPVIQPDPNPEDCEHFLDALERLEPFIGTDAGRMWACGIYLNAGYAYATNNICLVRSKVEFTGQANLPSIAIDEILRIGKQPEAIAYGENTTTLYYEDGSWLRTNLLALEWPNIEAFLQPVPTEEIPEDLLADIKRIQPFGIKKTPTVRLSEAGIAVIGENKDADIDSYVFPNSLFRIEPLLDVLKVAKRIDFSAYPKACYFEGDDIVGVIIGVRET